MENFELYYSRYADLLISYALNIQPGQNLYINAEIIHQPLCERLARLAYEKGAKYVQVDFFSPQLIKARLDLTQNEEDLSFVSRSVKERYEEAVDLEAASLRLVGSEEPDLLADSDPKRVNLQQLGFRKSLKRYYQEGVGKSKVAWTVAAHATPAWAKRLFPNLSEKEAYDKLWSELFQICRVDKENYLELWKEHNDVLKRRAKKLDDLKIKELHFTGPGTDLKVYLTKLATFRGGSDFTSRKVLFEPNIPTEECFTTPDCRLTEGYARVTRPFLVNGKLIEGLKLHFKEGRITDFEADKGGETFKEYIDSDEGGRKLGEVALVGIDSPIFQCGHIFEEILLDENAACHIAVGFAYPFCLRGGENMSEEEYESNGCNRSHCHVDMMISDENVDVVAATYDGQKVQLIKKGRWQI